MFQPSDKFYTNIQLNSVIFEAQGVVVHEVLDIEKRKKFVLIERSTSDENEYADLQKDICAFDKSESPYIIKIHRYTYDLVIPEQKICQNNGNNLGGKQNIFQKSGNSVMGSSGILGMEINSKKIYKLSFLTDYFTTNLKLWIEKKRDEIDKHNSQFKMNSLYSKGNIRKGLPQYEFCSLFHQMVEGINHVYQREIKRSTSSTLKEYVCKVDIMPENFVINESVDLENKIKFIPMHFLSVYNKNYKKRYASLLDHQKNYIIKRRQTLELQNGYIQGFTSPKNSTKSNQNSAISSKSKTFSHILESDFATSTKSSAQIPCLTNIIQQAQAEDTETKYMRMLFDLGLRLGSLYIGADNFTEPNQPLSPFSRQVLVDICKQYKNLSKILVQMIDPSLINSNYTPSSSYRRPSMQKICTDLKKINDQEFQYDENNFSGHKISDDLMKEDETSDDDSKNVSSSKSNFRSLLQITKQNSINTNSVGSLSTIPLSNELIEQNNNNLFKQKSLNSQSLIKHRSSIKRRSTKLQEKHLSDLQLSPKSQTSCQIEIYDIEYAYEKKPKKYKGLAFVTPYTNILNIIHVNEKKNAYIEKVEMILPERVVIPHEHSIIVTPGVGEFKIFILGGEDSIQVLQYDSNKDGKLVKKSNMIASIERRQFGICTIERDSQILVATGIRDEQLTNQCEIYDLNSNCWTKISNVNVPVVGSSLCLFNKSSVYKFGGVDANGKIPKIIERYDIYQDIWKCIQYDIDPHVTQNINFAKNMLSFQINHNQIVIFSGELNTHNNYPNDGSAKYKHIRHPFYSLMPSSSSPPPPYLNKKIFFCHIDKLGHHELFGIDQYGSIPDNAGYILPGQICLSESDVIFFQKQLYRQDTGRLMGFSVEKQVKDIRGSDIRF
ncbi:hypothetical protein ABPG72_012938 [Tetrahymena utriculariae]